MKKILILMAFVAFNSFASQAVDEFKKNWQFSRLEYSKEYATKLFQRYIQAGDKHWPVAELIYYQKDLNKKKMDLKKFIDKKAKSFKGVEWLEEVSGKTLVRRGFSKEINRFIEIQVWPSNVRGFRMSLSFTRRGYFKSINKELVYLNKILQNPKARISWFEKMIIDSAYANDELSGENMLFSEVMIRTALESNQIVIQTDNGGGKIIGLDQASDEQIQTFEAVKKEYLDLLDEREEYLKEQERHQDQVERELKAQQEEADAQAALEEELELERQELARRAELIENYQQQDQKLREEKIKIMDLERLADEALLILEEIETQNNPDATIEELIIKYADITGREANIDCVDCAAEQAELFPTGFMNRVMNFLGETRQKGRDPKMEFCKKYEQIIRSLISLEHFNQEARSIILQAENEVYRRLQQEIEERQARYEELNSGEAARERQATLAALYGVINRADRDWMKENKGAFMNDCQEEKYSEYEGDDPLMKTSYELAKEIVDSHNPIRNVHDFFFNFFCFSERCKIKRACKQVYKAAIMPELERPERQQNDFAPDSLIMRQQVLDAQAYFDDIRDQMNCYRHLRITYDPQDFSNARHMTNPSTIPECSKEGAEDAVRLYNLKKKLLNTFNEQECPQKIDSFYHGLATSGLIFPESQEN